MIRIEHSNIDKIVDKHYSFVYNDAIGRLNFYIDLFDCLGNGVVVPSAKTICERYDFKRDVTPKTLINPFLKNNKKKKKQKYKVTINEINSVLFTNTKHIIKDSNNLTYFRSLYQFFVHIKNDIKLIITGPPADIDSFNHDSRYTQQSNELYKKCIENIFRYEEFTKVGLQNKSGENWNSYRLTSNLNISTCPYCNRNWINTVTTSGFEKVVNPQLDHFFCKAIHPLLRLSFYNLIPSCDTCNSRLKGQDKFNLKDYLHPYISSYGDRVKFRALALNTESAMGSANDYSITLEFDEFTNSHRSQIEKNHFTFKVNEIYMKHGDIVSELYKKKYIFSVRYLEILSKSIQSYNLTYNEIYKIAFGNFFQSTEFNKRPFSKLTKDIAEQLGMIPK
jgi:hypothetical protein